MKKEFINEINKILKEKEIDNRIKPLIKLYFMGKFDNLTIEELKTQIDILCERIQNIEFSSNNNIIAGYTDKLGVITINKQLFIEGKAEEAILPLFMKFEEVLNQNNRRNYANHIEDFIEAGEIAQSISLPISDRLYKLYEMARYCYGDIEYKVDKLINDGLWEGICYRYNNALNKMIVTGKDNAEELLNGVNLFHYEVFTDGAFNNEDFNGPYKNEEYQRKAARILGYIDELNNDINYEENNQIANSIKLFTGCTQEMIDNAKSITHTNKSEVSDILKSTMQSSSLKISEEYIAEKVQKVIDRKPEWDSRIKHLIIPFFIRSQKVYNWDIDDFQERLNQLDLKIDKIVFEDLKSITDMGSTAMNTIKLNSRVFFDKKRKTFLACNYHSFS